MKVAANDVSDKGGDDVLRSDHAQAVEVKLYAGLDEQEKRRTMMQIFGRGFPCSGCLSHIPTWVESVFEPS